MAQIITPERAKLGPDNNFTAYIYIHIHMWPKPRFCAPFRQIFALNWEKAHDSRPKKARPVLVVHFFPPFSLFVASQWPKIAVFALQKGKKVGRKRGLHQQYHLLGARFRTTKIGVFEDFCDKFWCQLVFFCFVFLVQLVTSDLLFSILPKMFFGQRGKKLGFFLTLFFEKKAL